MGKRVSLLLLIFLTSSIFLILSVSAYSTDISDWKVVAKSDWKLIAESESLKYYIDTKSISKYVVSCSSYNCFPWYKDKDFGYPPDRFIRAWIKKVDNTSKQYEAEEELDYEEWDCIDGRRRLLYLTKCYPDGMSESFNLNRVIKWDSNAPHTFAEFLHRYLCKER